MVWFIKRAFLFYEYRVQGTIDLEAGNWIIQARAKNTDRWADDRFAQEYSIKIPKGESILVMLFYEIKMIAK